MRVRDIHREKVPKHLIIDSCNLKLNETIGQGNIAQINVVSYVSMIPVLYRRIWHCLQSTAV